MENEIHSRLSEIGSEIARAATAFRSSFEPLANQYSQLNRSVEVALKSVVTSMEETKRGFEAAFASVADQIKAVTEGLHPIFQSIAQALEQLPEKNREALRLLAENGWYLDPQMAMSMPVEMAAKFAGGQATEAHDMLCSYFEERIPDLERYFRENLPARGRLLSYAFDAHRQGAFALSIPVFLAQADGICQEITGEQLYSRRNGYPKIASLLLPEGISPLSASLLTPIIEPMPISANAKEREQLGNILNRHGVLHGESTDYDNRLNGCRAISLLVYVEWILENGAQR